MQQRRLYRSRSEKMLFGVCGGIADYFAVDPTIIRVLFAILALLNGIGILLYLALAIIMPPEPPGNRRPRTEAEDSPSQPSQPQSPTEGEGPTTPTEENGGRQLAIALLAVVGLALLLVNFAWPLTLFLLPLGVLPFGLSLVELPPIAVLAALILALIVLLVLIRHRARQA